MTRGNEPPLRNITASIIHFYKTKNGTYYKITQATTFKPEFNTFFGHFIMWHYNFHLFLNSAYWYAKYECIVKIQKLSIFAFYTNEQKLKVFSLPETYFHDFNLSLQPWG